MKTKPYPYRALAKRLVELSLDEKKHLSPERIQSIWQFLQKGSLSAGRRKNLLKAYVCALKDYQQKHTLEVSVAGPLSKPDLEGLCNVFRRHYGEELESVSREQPNLLGGVRVKLGDNTYDFSVAGRLAFLAQCMHSSGRNLFHSFN